MTSKLPRSGIGHVLWLASILSPSFCSVALSSDSTSVHRYYQEHNRLFVDGREVVTVVGGTSFSIFAGVVSPRGSYCCGILIDEQLEERLRPWVGGDGDCFLASRANRLVVCSLTDDSLVYSAYYRNVPDVYFSESESCILYGSDSLGEYTLVDIKRGRVVNQLGGQIHDVRFIGDSLFVLMTTDQLCLWSYDFRADSLLPRFAVMAPTEDVEWCGEGWKSPTILSPDSIMARCRRPYLITPWSATPDTSNAGLKVRCGDRLLLYGLTTKDLDSLNREAGGLYVYVPQIGEYSPLVQERDIVRLAGCDAETQVNCLSCTGTKMLLFAKAGCLRQRNLIEYDLISGNLVKVTSNGFVAPPAGYFFR